MRADRDEFLRRWRDLVSKGFNFDHVDTVDVRAFERSIVLFDIAVVPIVKPAVDIYPGVCLDRAQKGTKEESGKVHFFTGDF